MTIARWDEAQATRAEGVVEMCRGCLVTVKAVAAFAARDFEAGTMETARAAEHYAEGAKLLATPGPELSRLQRFAVWARRHWLRLRRRLRLAR